MSTILVLGEAATDPGLEAARATLRSRGDVVSQLVEGGRADVVVAVLPPGARVVPADISEAARGAGARGLLLCSSEPLVRPLSVLGAGNVVLISPRQRRHVLAALDLLDGQGTASGQQVLARDAWAAWTGAAASAPVSFLPGDLGVTLVHPRDGVSRPEALRLAAAALATAEPRRRAALQEHLGERVCLVHLAPGAGSWLVHWPRTAAHLWLYSPLRLPAQWSLSAALANSGQTQIKLPAFGGDVVVATSVRDDRSAEVLAALPAGALDVHRALERVTHEPGQWGFVIEVR